MDGDSRTRNGNDLVAPLVERGVNPDLAVAILTDLLAPIVERTVAWYDAQHGRVGPGVLVAELRAGGTRAPRTPVPVQGEYTDRVVAWLREHFPDLKDDPPARWPHPAAISAVTRLHWRHGKHWGPPSPATAAHIRAAVRNFELEWGTAPSPSEAAQPDAPGANAPTAAPGQNHGSGSAAPPSRDGGER